MTSIKEKTGVPTGVGVALLAAALFGASTPFAKLLLGEVSPVLLAGLLYSVLGQYPAACCELRSTKCSKREAQLTLAASLH